jgi:hypothetical protein
LEDPLAEEILKGELAADEVIEADYVKDEEVIQLKRIKK